MKFKYTFSAVHEREKDIMKKILLAVIFVFLSNNVHAFDYCSRLEKAVKICCSEIQTIDSNFDAYISHCDVKEAVYDKVDNVFLPIEEKGENRVQLEAVGNTVLRFKFSKCLRGHNFNVKFDEKKANKHKQTE
jgi:hypothetical protein